MSDELMDLLSAEAYENTMRSREWGDFLNLLRLTGARPGEIRYAEAFNYTKGQLIFRWNTTRGYVHKNAKKSQRDRVIFLTGVMRKFIPAVTAFLATCALLVVPVQGREDDG